MAYPIGSIRRLFPKWLLPNWPLPNWLLPEWPLPEWLLHERLLLMTLLLLATAWSTALAQSGRRPQGRVEKPIVRIETVEVVLPLLAFDAGGRLVDDLQPREVVVLEDKEARQVASLKREAANIVFVIDGSNEYGTFKNGPTQRFGHPERPVWEKPERSALPDPTSREFALRLLGCLSPRDRVSIIQYSDRVQLIQNWTNDPQQAMESLRSKYRVGLKASYRDALKMAADKLQEVAEGRRLVVLLTDGLDSASRTSAAKVELALEQARATLFVVGWADVLRREIELAVGWMRGHENFTSASAGRIGELRRYLADLDAATAGLKLMAERSGGVFRLPATHEDLTATARPLSEEIGAQYSLSFITERKPSLEDYRSIDVLPARPGLSLRSRRTYYAGDAGKDSANDRSR